MPTRDKGLHCKGRVCIFSSLIKFTAKRHGTGDRPSGSHRCFFRPLLHTHTLLHHKGWHARPPPCQKNATLQTIPTVACRQSPEPICSTITLIWAIQRLSIYMRKLKAVKPPEIPGMGVSLSWQKKWKENKRNNVTDKLTSRHNASVAITDTHQRPRYFLLASLPSHKSLIPQFSQSNTKIYTKKNK